MGHTAHYSFERTMIEKFETSHRDAGRGEIPAEEPFGPLVFQTALPNAIRSLDDAELRILLIALLQEWRCRGGRMCG
jgi:hypothetical protein